MNSYRTETLSFIKLYFICFTEGEMERARSLCTVFFNQLWGFNIYVECHSDSPRSRRDQILSTRLYVVLLLLSAVSLSGYVALSWRLLTFEIHNPTFTTFEHLQAEYPETLTCTCTHIAVDVGKFVSIAVSFHQVGKCLGLIEQSYSLGNELSHH